MHLRFCVCVLRRWRISTKPRESIVCVCAGGSTGAFACPVAQPHAQPGVCFHSHQLPSLPSRSLVKCTVRPQQVCSPTCVFCSAKRLSLPTARLPGLEHWHAKGLEQAVVLPAGGAHRSVGVKRKAHALGCTFPDDWECVSLVSQKRQLSEVGRRLLPLSGADFRPFKTQSVPLSSKS